MKYKLQMLAILVLLVVMSALAVITPYISSGFYYDEVLNAEIQDGKIILSKTFQHRTLQERAAAFGGKLNLSEEITWDDPQGNEVW